MSTIKKILVKILGPIILSKSKIVSNEQLSPHFHLLTIKGRNLKKEWIPGQKIQIQLKDDEMRSYTPCSWDSKAGVMQTLVYMHGKGPGALWARDAKAQNKVIVLGPKKSLKLEEAGNRVIFFGDETTFGLAHAIKKNVPDIKFHFFMEAGNTDESSAILKRFDLEEALLVSLGQLDLIAEQMSKIFAEDNSIKIVLSGKQQSIVALREKLYSLNIPKAAIGTKVYWGWKDDPNGKLKK
ncbi:siderophore-interacting protein [Bacteriovorax sp. PP10]|uniref:Siderophore-interacting protein n=1 Tax=Bacteriovorax antarcticus TaxID=3088717 RepID=A0ABU5VSQ7_9BACT|nr:siderophore-interacting protein [Bacteriovorax sp. PP10]MEA9356089.1 siderophore-interacting protein [Bacteriovorax sp. PP10]